MQLQLTDDGSTTIYLPEIDEHYHSVKGAITESRHIYRDCAFLHYPSSDKTLRLLEVGFGTALNASLTAMTASASHRVHYITLERFPISIEMAQTLGYEQFINPDIFQALHKAPWGESIAINEFFEIEKRLCDFTCDSLPNSIDVVYLDSFAPEKQPEMWTNEALSRLVDVMNPGAILTTYCAKGEIRRRLQALGLVVERIAGPPGGKREILRATKPV